MQDGFFFREEEEPLQLLRIVTVKVLNRYEPFKKSEANKMKKSGSRILGLLLAILMIIQVPYSALAENLEIGALEASSYETEASYDAAGIAEADNAVEETVAEDTTADEESTENLPAQSEIDFYEEDLTEETDILLEETEGDAALLSEEQILGEEVEAETESVEAVTATAEEPATETTEEAKEIQVTINVSKDGKFLDDKEGNPMAGRTVTLTGQSSYTMDDALKEAHRLYYKDGVEGYDFHTVEGAYAVGYIYKLWGWEKDQVPAIRFSINHDNRNYKASLTRTIQDGDEMHFYIQQQSDNSLEKLAFFTQTDMTVMDNEQITLQLRQYEGYMETFTNCEGASIYVDGVKQEGLITDENGKVTMPALVAREEPYFITAEKLTDAGITAISAAYIRINVIKNATFSGEYLESVTMKNVSPDKEKESTVTMSGENQVFTIPAEMVFNGIYNKMYLSAKLTESAPDNCVMYAVYTDKRTEEIHRVKLDHDAMTYLPNAISQNSLVVSGHTYPQAIDSVAIEIRQDGIVVQTCNIPIYYRNHLRSIQITDSRGRSYDCGFQDTDEDQHNLEITVPENMASLQLALYTSTGIAWEKDETTGKTVASRIAVNGTEINSSTVVPDWSNGQTSFTIAITLGDVVQEECCEKASYVITVKKGDIDYTPEVTIKAENMKEKISYPQYAVYQGDEAVVLEAEVGVEDSEQGNLSYSWYYAQSEGISGVPPISEWEKYTQLEGEHEKTCTIPTDTVADLTGYVCLVDYTINEKVYSSKSGYLCFKIIPKEVEQPEISQQPQGLLLQSGKTVTDSLTVELETKPRIDLVAQYQWYKSTDENTETGEAVTDMATGNSSYIPDVPEQGTEYYYCKVRYYRDCCIDGVRRALYSEEVCSDIAQVTRIEEEMPWNGAGTIADPYQIQNLQDLESLREKVNDDGYSFAGISFVMTSDIDLPSNWSPIGGVESGKDGPGNGEYMWPFSGMFDGGNHLITVAKDGLPLFRYTRNATIENLNIYGERIRGYGLINEYVVDYGTDGVYNTGCPDTAIIRNVTIKSGTQTLKSGLIGGYASGANHILIENCKVEKGVVIGYSQNEVAIGSFAGAMNGVIRNCYSEANVYGYSKVGGIAGSKGQAMGQCSIENCSFTGTVSASGNWAGGILGSGYEADSAPNTPVASVKNCYVAGTVSGAANVGGIFGGEPSCKQCWGNGSGSITNNFFYGTVSGSSNVGAIVGYLRSFDKFQDISNNYFLDTCGASKGIGTIEVILTLPGVAQDLPSEKDSSYGIDYTFDQTKYCFSKTTAEFADGTVTAGLNSGNYQNWTQGSSYPVYGQGAYATSLSLTGDYKKEYYIGEELDLSGGTFTVTWSDGTKTHPEASEITAIGYDANTQGSQMLTLKYGAVETTITVGVLLPSGQIEISFTLLGDYEHDSDADQNYHTLANNNLETWVPETKMVVSNNATVKDVLEEVLTANGMTWVNKNGNYVSAITRKGVKMAEFTNGKKSGWMYTLNGKHPNVAINAQYLKNGDILVFHYTDDFVHESHDHQWSGSWSSNGVVHWHACEWGCGQTKDQASHTWGSWKTTTKATVFAPAIQIRNCSVCGWKETRNTGNKLTPVLTLPGKLTSFNMKKNQSVSFGITMANGDSIASVTSGNSKILKVVSVNKKNGKITLKGLKTGSTKLTIKLASKKSVTYKVKVVSSAVKTTAVSVTNVTNKKLTLAKGKSYALKTERKPFTSTQTVTYASSNKKVVAVNGKGVLTAKKAGRAKITVKSGSKKVVVTVTVPQTKTTALSVTSSVTVKKGKTYALKVKKTPANSDQSVTYTTSNKKIATVTSAGKIKGVKKGTTTITVKSGSIIKKIKVTVK